MRTMMLLLLAAALAWPNRTVAQPARRVDEDRAARVAAALAAGDGAGPATAWPVTRAVDAHAALLHLRLAFLRQRAVVEGETVLDIVTVRTADGVEREVFFRSPAPERLPAEARAGEQAMRRIMTSGDGRTPETAFVVGGAIGAEYRILLLMGLVPEMQMLVNREGCFYDLQQGRERGGGEKRAVWFRLGGGGPLAYTGTCEGEPR